MPHFQLAQLIRFSDVRRRLNTSQHIEYSAEPRTCINKWYFYHSNDIFDAKFNNSNVYRHEDNLQRLQPLHDICDVSTANGQS